MKAAILLALGLSLTPLAAHAQDINFGALEERANLVTVSTGLEYGFVFGAGYARALSRDMVLGGDVTLGWAEADLGDFRLRAGGQARLFGRDRWHLIGGLAATVRGTRNDISQMINIGTDAVVLAGYYAPHWFVAGELGFDWALATHVTHDEDYRMAVYADARDGWYGNAGGNLRYGLQGGVSLSRYDVILRAGRLLDVSGNAPMMPIYGTLSVGARF